MPPRHSNRFLRIPFAVAVAAAVVAVVGLVVVADAVLVAGGSMLYPSPQRWHSWPPY